MFDEKTRIYLKIEPINPEDSISGLPDFASATGLMALRYNRDTRSPFFGMISRFSLDSEKYNYKVLEYYPHSIETRKDNRKTRYQTTTEALQAAIKFLNKKGCVAKTIDLEGMLALVKIPRP